MGFGNRILKGNYNFSKINHKRQIDNLQTLDNSPWDPSGSELNPTNGVSPFLIQPAARKNVPSPPIAAAKSIGVEFTKANVTVIEIKTSKNEYLAWGR